VRRTSLTLAAALPLLAVAACAREAPESRPTAMVTVPKPASEVLTPEVARREYQEYVTNDDVARAAGDERLALTWVSDGQSLLTAAEYRKAAYDGDPVQRFQYGTPKLYVPKLSDKTYPQWFVASVQRNPQGEAKEKRTALMAFIRRAPEERWTLSLTSLLAPKAKEPKVPVDPAGYAGALTTADTSVLIRPREVPGIQATMAAEGPRSVAAKVMKAGPVTTGYYHQARRLKRRARDKDLTLQVVVVMAQFPVFPLRTEHDGGLVLYSLFRNSVTGTKDRSAGVRPPIPAEAAHLLDGTVEGNEINMSETLHFAAYDPARPTGGGHPKAEVVAYTGAVTKASTPPAKTP
jgi:hypothetical protein